MSLRFLGVRRRNAVILFGLLLCSIGTAYAHRFHFANTEMSFNPRTSNTEIVHTLMTHDVTALFESRHRRQIDLSNAEDVVLLKHYVESHFYLTSKDKRAIPIRWVGATVNNDTITVFQEIEGLGLASIQTIHQSVLLDFIEDQINTVNIIVAGDINTLTFDQEHREQVRSFP
jgi:hypothetical protein